MIGMLGNCSNKSLSALAQASMLASVKESITRSGEAPSGWRSSSDTVEYVTTGHESANCTLRQMRSRTDVRLSISAMKRSTFPAVSSFTSNPYPKGGADRQGSDQAEISPSLVIT